MHPEFLREMTDQRTREMRARAHQARLARLARLASVVSRRGRHPGAPVDEADGFVIPVIPDYVDGSFRAEVATGEASQEPATHHAA
jgi:hypothetical protein